MADPKVEAVATAGLHPCVLCGAEIWYEAPSYPICEACEAAGLKAPEVKPVDPTVAVKARIAEIEAQLAVEKQRLAELTPAKSARS